MRDLNKIKNIAKKIRKAFEEIEKKENDGFGGYGLGGYCVRAAAQLYLACKKAGIKVKIVEGVGHAFNEFDGYIIDITATQFGKYPKVHIRKYKNRPPEFYQKISSHLSTKSLIETFWIKQLEIENDEEIVSKYFPGKTGGQRRKRNVKT